MAYLQNSTPTIADNKPLTLPKLHTMHQSGEKIAALTAYDASFAHAMQAAGVELLLVGDSLGMVCQGRAHTLAVTVADIAYHTQAVARAKSRAVIAADMPFASYANKEEAYRNAAVLIQSGAEMVKLEGGVWLAETVEFLTTRAIPVWAHIGLMPQSVHHMGGYKIQGKDDNAVQRLIEEAQTLGAAGASMLLLEGLPAATAARISQHVAIPTIGIGAGRAVSGQILVMHDLLGVFPGKKARFVRNFVDVAAAQRDHSIPLIQAAFAAYVAAVKGGDFPNDQEGF